MVAVITGDIVSSRTLNVKNKWIARLKDTLDKKAGLPKAPKWGTFRGDGFQVELSDPSTALRIAILIRAGLRSLSPQHKLDVRLAIGIGEKGYSGKSVNDSTGEAYFLSGTLLDSLKEKKHRLEITTPWPGLNKYNIALELANVIMEGWTFASAEITWLKLSDYPTQEQMARKLRISQPAVHKRLATAHFQEIENLVKFFEAEVIDSQQSSKK